MKNASQFVSFWLRHPSVRDRSPSATIFDILEPFLSQIEDYDYETDASQQNDDEDINTLPPFTAGATARKLHGEHRSCSHILNFAPQTRAQLVTRPPVQSCNPFFSREMNYLLNILQCRR